MRRGINPDRIGETTDCRECGQPYRRNASGQRRCPSCVNTQRRALARDLIATIKATHPCQVCGEPDPVVLQFHHLDAATKWRKPTKHEGTGYATNGVSGLVWSGASPRRIVAEVNTCAILCANCHLRVEAGSVDASTLQPLSIATPETGDRWHPIALDGTTIARYHRPRTPVTHCRRGHPFDDENTYVSADGQRHCRTCTRAAERARYAKKHNIDRATLDGTERAKAAAVTLVETLA